MKKVPPVLLNILNERYSAKRREPNEPMVAGTMDPDIERGQFNITDPDIQISSTPETKNIKQYVPSPVNTAQEYEIPELKQSFSQKVQNVGDVASNLVKGIGKFGLAAYAGSYPFELAYDPVYSYTKEYVPEPLARTAAVGAGTAAAIPASEIAVVGIPETARTIARARELGLLGRTSLGLRSGAAETGTAIKSAARAAPYIAAGMVLAPYVWEADKEDAAKRAEMLQRFETKKENEAAIRKNLGLQQEESWLDRLKDNFAKAMILGGDRGIMAAGRQ